MSLMSLSCINLEHHECERGLTCRCECHDTPLARWDALVSSTAEYRPTTSLPRHAAQPRGVERLMTTVLGNVALSVALGVLIGLAMAIGVAVVAGGIQ